MSSSPEISLPCPYGKYELLKRLGQGGMAEVFKARLPGIAGFEKTLVIKRLHPRYTSSPGFVQMFIDEAKLAAQVQHKNVVQVFELGSLDTGELFIAMEFVDGCDLKGLMQAARRRQGRLPVWFSVHVVLEILDALTYAHDLADDSGRRRNIVHNDVTPENVFIAKHGDVKLGDFGVAHDDTRTSDPFPGQMKGKIPYMSPEQLSGFKVDARSDVFAAGIVLWEALTGQRLFQAETQSETMARICGAPRRPPSALNPDVTPALDKAVLSALSIERDQRMPSARAFQDALFEVLSIERGRVDPSDVQELVCSLKQGKETGALTPHLPPVSTHYASDELELDDPRDEPIDDAPALSAAEAALHLASPTATGELPSIEDPPTDVSPAPAPAVTADLLDPPPRRLPPPRYPSVRGRVQTSGSIKNGFTYTLVHPSDAKDAVTPPPAKSETSRLAEVDELFQQFLSDKLVPAQDAPTPSQPVRKMLSAARDLANFGADTTPAPTLETSHPFWVRFPDGREVGPLEPAVLVRYLGARPPEDLARALVSADLVRWVSTQKIITLLSDELIADSPQTGQCTFLGTLRGHSLTAVLGELARTRATGRLVLHRDREDGSLDRRELHIRDGQLTAISQNRATFDLWQGLLSSQFFVQHHLPESLYTAVRIQRPVVSLLSAEASAGLDQARALLARKQLRELFSWDNAHFGFDPSAEPLEGRPTPLLRLLPRMVSRCISTPRLRRDVQRFMDTPLERVPDFAADVARMEFHPTELERIEPLGHGYTLGESLAQSAPTADDRYALVISYVLLELRLLRPQRARQPSDWDARRA